MLNAVLFGVLLALSLMYWRRDPSRRVRRLWLTVALASGALVLGGVQRMVLQAAAVGWVDESTSEAAVMDWQWVQSVVVALFAVAAFLSVKRVAESMAATERVAGSIVDRVSHVDPDALDLSKREREVLDQFGRGLITDAELAATLHVSASTVQSHVKSLLRKTGLNRRQDLIAVAFLVDSVR